MLSYRAVTFFWRYHRHILRYRVLIGSVQGVALPLNISQSDAVDIFHHQWNTFKENNLSVWTVYWLKHCLVLLIYANYFILCHAHFVRISSSPETMSLRFTRVLRHVGFFCLSNYKIPLASLGSDNGLCQQLTND